MGYVYTHTYHYLLLLDISVIHGNTDESGDIKLTEIKQIHKENHWLVSIIYGINNSQTHGREHNGGCQRWERQEGIGS